MAYDNLVNEDVQSFLKLLNKHKRKSTRERKPSIYSDYVVYLQESDYNISAEK